jgi:hypothetical protein
VSSSKFANKAKVIQLAIEYDPQPPFDSGAPSKVSPEFREFVLSIFDGPSR